MNQGKSGKPEYELPIKQQKLASPSKQLHKALHKNVSFLINRALGQDT